MPSLQKFVQICMLLTRNSMKRADNSNWKLKPLCLMYRHKGNGSLRSAVPRVFKLCYTAIYDITKVVIEKIPDILFQIGRMQDLNMMQIFKFYNKL